MYSANILNHFHFSVNWNDAIIRVNYVDGGHQPRPMVLNKRAPVPASEDPVLVQLPSGNVIQLYEFGLGR